LSYKFITVGLDENLKVAVELLAKHKVHRIIIEEKSNGQISGFISHETIFDYFLSNYYSNEPMSLFKLPLKSIEKHITAKNIVTIKSDETLINAIKLFRELKVSILPVTEGDNVNNIIGFLYLKDVFYLFAKEEKFSVSYT
jgi:CBS domain-containing protein